MAKLARKAGRIVAVGGGKGGVGKSVVVTSVATALGRRGRRVVVIDADLGAANLHTMLGICRPLRTLQSFLDHEVDSLADVVIDDVVPGVSLIAGSSRPGAANINHGQKQRILRHIVALDAEIVILDIGAGSAFHALDFFLLSDLRLVVMTPQLTSLQNAYSFLKAAVFRAVHNQGDKDDRATFDALMAATGDATRFTRAVRRLRGESPQLAARIERTLAGFSTGVVGNMASDDEAAAFFAMSRMIQDFLGLAAPVVAVLDRREAVRASVNQRRPLALDAHGGDLAARIDDIAAWIVAAEPACVAGREVPGEARAVAS